MHPMMAMAILAAVTPQTRASVPPASPPAAAVSTAPLGRFPFLRWPAAFVPRAAPVDQPLGHFRFWDGTSLQDVEGRTFLVTLVRRDDRGAFDEDLLRRKVEGDLTRMGGVRIAAGRVPASVIATINDADRQALLPGLGDIGNSPVQTWIVRRRDRQIWVQYAGSPAQASIAVVATLPD